MPKRKPNKPTQPEVEEGKVKDNKDEDTTNIQLVVKAEIVEEDGSFQSTIDSKVDRRLHTWFKRPDGSYKCVICGGISKTPSYNKLPDRVEKLTHEERAMTTPEHKDRGRDRKRQNQRCDDEDS